MVQIRPELFPSETVKRLHARNAGPFKVLNKINDSAYVIDLPEYFRIDSTFNVEDLVNCNGPDFNHSNPLVGESSPEPFS